MRRRSTADAEHIRPAFAAFDTRIDHKLIAAATLRTATQAAILQAISKVLRECIGGGARQYARGEHFSSRSYHALIIDRVAVAVQRRTSSFSQAAD